MTNDAKTVGNNTKLEDVAKMTIDIQLLNDSVCVLWIIFGNESFNTRRIKDGHISHRRINRLADGLGNIDEVIEYKL